VSVVWAEAAIEQLEKARDFLSQTSSQIAHEVSKRIVLLADSLEGRPYFGHEVPEYGDPKLREVFEHPYRIMYRFKDEQIQVVALVHASRRLPRRARF
jgi:toxin ParE1/3/4